MLAITGITGQVGGAVARTLLAAHQPVRAVVRDAAKGRTWADKGCDVAVADMNNAAALPCSVASSRPPISRYPSASSAGGVTLRLNRLDSHCARWSRSAAGTSNGCRLSAA